MGVLKSNCVVIDDQHKKTFHPFAPAGQISFLDLRFCFTVTSQNEGKVEEDKDTGVLGPYR